MFSWSPTCISWYIAGRGAYERSLHGVRHRGRTTSRICYAPASGTELSHVAKSFSASSTEAVLDADQGTNMRRKGKNLEWNQAATREMERPVLWRCLAYQHGGTTGCSSQLQHPRLWRTD
jgi:hypothetical protein